MVALYYGGVRGYGAGDLLPEGCQPTKDLDEATKAAQEHPDGTETHGGTVYRVSRYGKRLRITRVVTPNISRNWDVEARI